MGYGIKAFRVSFSKALILITLLLFISCAQGYAPELKEAFQACADKLKKHLGSLGDMHSRAHRAQCRV